MKSLKTKLVGKQTAKTLTLHFLDFVGEEDTLEERFGEGELEFALVAVAAAYAGLLEDSLKQPESSYTIPSQPQDPLLRLWRRPIGKGFLSFPLVPHSLRYYHPLIVPGEGDEGEILAAYISRLRGEVVFPSWARERVVLELPLQSGARLLLLSI